MPANKHLTIQRFIRSARARMFRTGAYGFGTITLLAVLVGTVAGYGAIALYVLISALLKFSFGVDEEILATGASSLDWWHLLFVPTIGGLLVGLLLTFHKSRQTSGVASVIEAAAINENNLGLRDGLISAAATIVSLGSGASMGREGPAVHLGATLASAITKKLRLNPASGRILLGCGVAAAVSASFNAPIAGVFFALEIVIGHYALHTFAPIVIAAIAGTVVSRIHIGNFPAFHTTEYFITSFWEFPAFFLLGIVSALVAVIFMSGLNWADKLRVKFDRIPYWLQPGIAGLLIGTIALAYPEILSIGYEATSRALNGEYALSLLLPLILIKIVAAIISYAGRFGVGIFSPSLFIGAMLGGSFGIIAGSLFPALASTPGLYAIVGMGAVASAVLGAPISTMLIVFEITRDYNVTIAVMIASAVASIVTSLFYERSFFLMQLANRGVRLEGGKATYLLKSATIGQHMSRDFFTIQGTETVQKARELLIAQSGGILIVTDDTGKLTGVLSLGQIPTSLFEDGSASERHASEFSREPSFIVKTTDALEIALHRLDASGEDALPVISPTQDKTVVGLIKHRDVMKQYNRALLETQGQDQRLGRTGK
ncbi:chloride channel protein [Kordiimonas aquimaris]|uniref:chloride channel protein n=1 Tax=Kordiimonas aquimaris TaxID=707591 RepID=UPI0021CE952E|nr:chloride channel protein [Kordiimonas aquimaris]